MKRKGTIISGVLTGFVFLIIVCAVDLTEETTSPYIIYRPLEFVMTKRTIAAIISKTL
jgi:hypothetical protein